MDARQGRDLLGGPAPPERKRGRPPGSKNKQSEKLHKYVAARFDGLTPGQVAAELALPSKAEVKKHGSRLLAMVAKAQQLADALGVKLPEAWDMLRREREVLMQYVHPKLAAIDMTNDGEKFDTSPVIMMPNAPAPWSDPGEDETFDLQGVIEGEGREVTEPKSQDGQQSLALQGVGDDPPAD